jgi:hypothetical protein
MGKKIISFSLYGSRAEYTIGAICNAELAKIIYPDWICRFYYGDSVPKEIIEELSGYDNVELVRMEEDGVNLYMMWRFLACDDEDVDVMISRDTDSRLSFREKKLVDLFIESDKIFHDVRDNGSHNITMGGMWGIKKGHSINMKYEIDNFKKSMSYGHDQNFLNHVISPRFVGKTLLHCSTYHNSIPISKGDILSDLIENPFNDHFIGERFYHNNYDKPYNYVFY